MTMMILIAAGSGDSGNDGIVDQARLVVMLMLLMLMKNILKEMSVHWRAPTQGTVGRPSKTSHQWKIALVLTRPSIALVMNQHLY